MNRYRTKLVKLFYLMVSLILCLSTGCSKPEQITKAEQICVPEISKAEAMQAAEDVLGRMHFNIEKADVENGFIKTRPLQGAQFFEFWRSDNVGGRNSAEANLHSIRRIAQLHISESSGKEQGKLCISCNVKTQRLNLPEREIRSSTRAHEMFSRSERSMQRLNLDPEQRRLTTWVDLGPDPKLATRILKRIESQIAQKQKEPKL